MIHDFEPTDADYDELGECIQRLAARQANKEFKDPKIVLDTGEFLLEGPDDDDYYALIRKDRSQMLAVFMDMELGLGVAEYMQQVYDRLLDENGGQPMPFGFSFEDVKKNVKKPTKH